MSLPLLDARTRVHGARELAWAEPTEEHARAEARQADGTTTLPTAAELFVPSLPGLPNMADHPT
jgi:hypothetical protein